MPTLLFPALLSAGLVSLSFVPATPPTAPTGTYGVCGTAPEAAIIRLDIAPDNSFHYVNSSNAANHVDVRGMWELQGNTFVLRTTSGEVFEKWTIDTDDPCLRARKGLNFMRLCQVQESK